MRYRAVVLSALLVLSLAGVAASPAAATQAEAEGYAGAHVEFDRTDTAVVNYSVGETVILERVTMQSSSEARSGLGLDADVGLRAVTDLPGAWIAAQTQARASVGLQYESGGEMTVHDNQRGVVQFHAHGDDHVVAVELPADAQAASEDDSRVVVTTADGEGAFVVVGDGEVVVNDEGGVTAELDAGSELVYRQYGGERSGDDEETERLIRDGVATAEVYVQESTEAAGATAADAVEYGQDTAVEVEQESRDRVEFTVERAESDGKVVLATVSEEAFENAPALQVYVDGEAAVRADSYTEVAQSATEGDEPRFYAAQSATAEGAVDVVIGIDHFSERTVELRRGWGDSTSTPEAEAETDDENTPLADEGGGSDADGSGFGPVAALTAAGAVLFGVRRRYCQ